MVGLLGVERVGGADGHDVAVPRPVDDGGGEAAEDAALKRDLRADDVGAAVVTEEEDVGRKS